VAGHSCDEADLRVGETFLVLHVIGNEVLWAGCRTPGRDAAIGWAGRLPVGLRHGRELIRWLCRALHLLRAPQASADAAAAFAQAAPATHGVAGRGPEFPQAIAKKIAGPVLRGEASMVTARQLRHAILAVRHQLCLGRAVEWEDGLRSGVGF
jgi:hypothetical protein